MQHDTGNKDVYPLYSGTDLGLASSMGLSTVPYSEVFGDVGLTTDAKIESVAFDDEKFYDALQYYSNSSMLKKVVGPTHSVIVSRNKPYIYHSNKFTYPTVKRGNPYTFCGILVWVPAAGGQEQLFVAADTTPIDHIHIMIRARFDEWNPEFEQAQR